MKFVRFRSGLSENFLNTVKLFRWSVPPFLRFFEIRFVPGFLIWSFLLLFVSLSLLYAAKKNGKTRHLNWQIFSRFKMARFILFK